jgi:acyl-coenzyme A thioesterase PaaI-like protein
MVHSAAMSAPGEIPAVFGGRFDGLEEQRWPDLDNVFAGCFGCGTLHPTGLRVRTFRTEHGVLSPVFIARRYEGPRGAAHGGIVAAYLDEICGSAVLRATGRVSVTGELTVRYVKPVPVETALLGRGRVVTDHGRYLDVEAQLEELEGGRVVATGRARFFPVDGRG